MYIYFSPSLLLHNGPTLVFHLDDYNCFLTSIPAFTSIPLKIQFQNSKNDHLKLDSIFPLKIHYWLWYFKSCHPLIKIHQMFPAPFKIKYYNVIWSLGIFLTSSHISTAHFAWSHSIWHFLDISDLEMATFNPGSSPSLLLFILLGPSLSIMSLKKSSLTTLSIAPCPFITFAKYFFSSADYNWYLFYLFIVFPPLESELLVDKYHMSFHQWVSSTQQCLIHIRCRIKISQVSK